LLQHSARRGHVLQQGQRSSGCAASCSTNAIYGTLQQQRHLLLP
jgi:hypothetical protein